MTYSPDPEHFAAVGKRVQSTWDPGSRGEVIEWVSPTSFVVRWDGGYETICYTFEVDIEMS